MKPRIDYTQLAAQLNYSVLSEKLAQLLEQTPPKKRKQISDLLAPVETQLRELRAKGWPLDQLTKALNDFGVPIKSPALRDYLAKQTKTRSQKRSEPIKLVSHT